jgi:hypothetical protein
LWLVGEAGGVCVWEERGGEGAGREWRGEKQMLILIPS